MSSEANVQLLKEAYRQWHDSKGQNVDYWFDNVIGPQITFDSIPQGAAAMPFAKRYDDRSALRGYFDGLLADWSMQYCTMNEFVAQGDTVVALGHYRATAKATGKQFDSPFAMVFTIRDGKIAEFREFTDSAAVNAAFQPVGASV